MKKLLLLAAGLLLFSQSFAQKKPKPPVVAPEEQIYVYVDENMEFPGGMNAFIKYISQNIRYPETARESNLEGKCYLKFVIEKDGRVSNVEVARGVPGCPECDREAVRVIKAMPRCKPAKIDGKPVRCYNDIPINFVMR